MKAAPTRSDALRLEPLRPTAETCPELRAAYFRLVAAREDNVAQSAKLSAERDRLISTGTTPEIAAVDDALRARKLFAEQLGVLEGDLRRRFDLAKSGEEDAAYDARLSELKAIEAAWNDDFRTRYPALAAELVALIEREGAIYAAYADLAKLPGASRALLSPGTRALTASMQSAHLSGHPHYSAPLTFSAAVVLPNTKPGGPLWLGKRWKL